jgi:hypothetical protein
MRQISLNLLISLFVLAVGLIFLEYTSRWLYPIAPAVKYYTDKGVHTTIGSVNPFRLKPGQYRQTASEFDVKISVDKNGNRRSTTVDHPDVIFLGDSFTFGQGLEDNEVFANNYCTKLKLSCVNLARSGSGTLAQVEGLKHYLTLEKWKPKKIKLFILAMTGSLMEGNDIKDNLNYQRDIIAASSTKAENAPEGTDPTNLNSFFFPINLSLRRELLLNLNIARIGYFFFAPFLRSKFSPKAEESELKKGLELTQKAIEEIYTTSQLLNASLEIYVVHPMQDIARKSYVRTVKSIRKISPKDVPVVSTGQIFKDNYSSAYYSFDGHFNPLGSSLMSRLLLDQKNIQNK